MTKRKTKKLDVTKTKNFYGSKDTIKNMKREPREREKMYLTRDVYPEYVKNTYNSTIKTNNPI